MKLLNFVAGVLVALGFLLSANVAHADEWEEFAKRLIELRSQVEELNSELDFSRQEHSGAVSALSAQKAELEATLNRLQTESKQLEQKLSDLSEEAQTAGVDDETLRAPALTALDQLEAHIQSGIPFKRDERLADLNEIRGQLEGGVLAANRAANRIWAFFEDEIRLTRENGIHSQTIELNGQRLLADVARLGTVMMFFRTDDERFGEVVPQGDNWAFRQIEDAEQTIAIKTLFDSLAKQIRQGYFEIPNVLGPIVRQGAAS